MGKADRLAAIAALPAFRVFVRRQVNYRVVHACKFQGERRFKGFAAPHLDAEAIAAAYPARSPITSAT